jgi:Kef-type K+ transport system membrane component KefB
MKNLRNIAIVFLLAAGVAFLPGGGQVTEAILQTLSIAFLAVIAFAAWRFLRDNEFTLLAMQDSRRSLLFGAIALLVLLVAGMGSMWSSGLLTFVWLILLGVSLVTLWRVWAEARTG